MARKSGDLLSEIESAALAPEGYVDHDNFLTAVMPFSTMVREVADAGYTGYIEGPNGMWHARDATVDPRALAELAQQAEYAGAWDQVPIDTALTHTGLLFTAAEDAMRTFASAVIADQTPLYAYIPLGRAALECLALAHWLGEPGIGTRERIRRSINERIASAWEQSKLPGTMNPEPDRQDRLLGASEKGWEVTNWRGLRQLGTKRPTITKHVQRVLGDDEDDALGKVLYSYTSAVSHGVLWSLAQRVDVPADASGPVVTGALAHSSESIAMMASALVIADKRAFGGFAGYMGWDVTEWVGAVDRADSTIKAFLSARRQARPEPDEPAPDWRLSGAGLWLPEPPAFGMPTS